MIIITFFILLITLFLVLPEKKYLKYGVAISFIALALIFGFRNNLGSDDSRYKFFYEIIQNKDTNSYWELTGVEKSYQLIALLLSSIGLNYKSIFLFYSSISFLFLYLATKELKLNKTQSFIWILLFTAICFVPYMTVMRQFAASMIFLYTLLKYNLKQWKYWIPLFTLSVLLHHFTIFMIPLFFLKKTKFLNNRRVLVFLPIFCFILNILPFWDIIRAIFETFGVGYANYIKKDGTGLQGSGIFVLSFFILYIISILKINKTKNNENTEKVFQQLGSIFFSIYFLTKGVGFAGRAYYGLYIFEGSSLIVLLSSLPDDIKEEYQKLLYASICTALISLSFYNFTKLENDIYNTDNYSIQLLGDKND